MNNIKNKNNSSQKMKSQKIKCRNKLNNKNAI